MNRNIWKQTALAVAIGVSSGLAFAQATSPAAAGNAESNPSSATIITNETQAPPKAGSKDIPADVKTGAGASSGSTSDIISNETASPGGAAAGRSQSNRATSDAPSTRTSSDFLKGQTSAGGTAWATGVDIHSKAPPKFKEVSTLVKLPDFLPGLGRLYVDPATLPIGPFLGYDRSGKLMNMIYMVPLKDMNAHQNFNDLGALPNGLKINHIDIDYNPGHPGVAEPHYHFIVWLIPHSEEAALK